jgi:ribosomal protein S18 acetylase RimI-like enzyme
MSKQIEASSLVEAAKQALEAIANSGDFLFNWHDCEPNNEREMSRYQEVSEMNEKAFTALRTAISEVERYEDEKFKPDWMNYQEGFAAGVLEGREQMKQSAEELRSVERVEPVAIVTATNHLDGRVKWLRPFSEGIPLGTKFYTTPPAAPVQELVCVCGAVWNGQELVEAPAAQWPAAQPHKWVGLDRGERDAVRASVNYTQYMTAVEYAEKVQEVTEQRLKEKNHHE